MNFPFKQESRTKTGFSKTFILPIKILPSVWRFGTLPGRTAKEVGIHFPVLSLFQSELQSSPSGSKLDYQQKVSTSKLLKVLRRWLHSWNTESLGIECICSYNTPGGKGSESKTLRVFPRSVARDAPEHVLFTHSCS